ncbi:Ribonuclease P protein subunit p25-like protein [Lonchura striata]|uniref:Ribonuclease P protein subunit p25-like protein n=1 Tax=Lonchura striata TaxID=40157 RepID=A0A218UZC0_9PASE|nr:Ribonuclease P protein subunit p25-like protein [Lonchura striata domestica]
MENYKKTKIVEKPCPPPFTDLPADIIEMKVKDGSKIRNLMGYAMSKMEQDSVRQILFTGSGKAVSKTITCVEIMKRRLKELHQITKVLFKQIEEIWEPIVPEAGLDALTVKRNIPAICVLLSKDALDPQESGYQAPGSFDAFWTETLKAESQGQMKRKQVRVHILWGDALYKGFSSSNAHVEAGSCAQGQAALYLSFPTSRMGKPAVLVRLILLIFPACRTPSCPKKTPASDVDESRNEEKYLLQP